MIPLNLTKAEERAFDKELVSDLRRVRTRVAMLNRHGDPLPHLDGLDVTDGGIDGEWSDDDSQPAQTCQVTVIDIHGRLDVDIHATSEGKMWFNKQIQAHWDVWLPAPHSKWVHIAVFTGWINDIVRHGVEVEITAASKDSQHIPPQGFVDRYTVKKATRYGAAIKQIFADRGETRFEDFGSIHRRLSKTHTWGMGQSPWHAGRNLAKDIDKQLFYRGNGHLAIRDTPTKPVFRFLAGPDSVMTDYPEERISMENVFNYFVMRGQKTVKGLQRTETELSQTASAGDNVIHVTSSSDFSDGRTVEIGGEGAADPEVRVIADSYNSGDKNVPLKSAIAHPHRKGALVVVRFKGDKTVRVAGRARLDASSPLSSATLTDGKRPILKIVDRSRVHKQDKLQELADKAARAQKIGVQDEPTVTCAPIPHLELMDLARVHSSGVERTFRIKRYHLPLVIDADMTLNSTSKSIPSKHRPHKQRHGNKSKARHHRRKKRSA